jgi:hypothetical protein
MPSDAADHQSDLEQVRCRLEGFRNTQPGRSRLPAPLWSAAAELAKRHGVNSRARHCGWTIRVCGSEWKTHGRAAHPQRSYVWLARRAPQ